MDFSARVKKENPQSAKDIPSDEESKTEKENKGKDKVEEEKYYTKTHHVTSSKFHLSDKDNYVYFNTRLKNYPCLDTDIQPPKAV
jgi:hypothetical protein